MDSHRWQQIEEIFQAALDSSETERERILAERCGNDVELRSEVEKLLTDFNSAEDFIESPVWTATSLMDSAVRNKLDKVLGGKKLTHDATPLGRRIGVYELKQEIGRGGMGAVYLAERIDGEFRQKVAIKLIKRGMDTDFVLSRFRRERQILANLNHPNIVLLLDGGTTDDGLPYFVMDYVEGEPLTKHVKNTKHSLREKLELFIKICEAVDYAHQKNIIHRDLKPSNILVNHFGVPKLLDFGIAKLLDPDLSDDTYLPTETQMRLMTPEYASPEQITGGEITQLSDVYSLGVMLYEVVTGVRPYKFTNRSPLEVARVITESKFVRPSKVLNADGSKEADAKAIQAQSEKESDVSYEALDCIIYQALNKVPGKRYQSAAVLAEDLNNYLENQPVNAGSLPAEKTSQKKSIKKSVAILPFRIISASGQENTEDLFLGIGLADALVSRLSGVQRLVVRPTSSVLPFAEENPIQAGIKMGVDFVLDGNIRRVGDRIRITVQLLNVAAGSTDWAEKFDERLTDVLELEDLISERVAKILLPQLSGEEKRRLEKRGTNVPEAYQAYLRGRYFINQFSDEALKKAIEAYEEAIRLDPVYVAPRVGMADFYIWSSIFGEFAATEAYPLAKKYAEDALKFDEYSAEAHAILAFITLLYEWNWNDAEKLCRRALELNPNYHFAHECYSNILVTAGNFEQGAAEIKLAEELDPVSPRAKLMTSWVLYQVGNFEEAVIKTVQANDMQSNFPQGLLHSGNIKAHLGRTAEAVAELRRCLELWNSGLPKHLYCYALVANGELAAARSILEEIKETARSQYMKPYFVAAAYAALGELDGAFEWFEKSIDERDEWLIWVATDPKLENLRSDERYFQILSKINSPLADGWQESTTGKTTTARNAKSIAVLPFKFIGSGDTGDTDDEYLSIGLADALTMRLSNVRRFIVRPTNSVIGFASRPIDSFQAGRELGVEYVVDGNIRRVGDRYRVAAHLLKVEDSSTSWAERFDEDSTDVLMLEDSISERVAKSLLPKLSDEEQQRLSQRGTVTPEAYDALMKARFYFNQFQPDTYPKALEWAEKAVELDPLYAQAYAALAQFYHWASIFGMIPPMVGLEKTKRAAYRAIELDDKSSEAYASLGFMVAYAEWKWEEGEEYFKKAAELNPNNPLAHEWIAVSYTAHGKTEEGIKAIRRAEMLDPLSQRQMILTAWTLYQLHQFDDALAKAREVIRLIPEYWQGYTQAGNVLVETGDINEAIELLKTAVRLAPGVVIPQYKLCAALAKAGRMGEAKEVLREIESEPSNVENSPYLVAIANAVTGEKELAFEYLQKAYEAHDLWMVWMATEPKLNVLRDDPRFTEILEKINLKPLQQ